MFKWVAPDHRRLILSIMLVSLLFLVYLLTLAGVNRSNDELWIIDEMPNRRAAIRAVRSE